MDSAVTCKLPQFEGPLELLLHLISKNKVEIADIPVALICEQYLDTLAQMREMDMEIASSFIVMAAQLIYIKSRMLLPVESADEVEEDPRAGLVEALLAYQQFKMQTERLAPIAEHGFDRLTRGAVLPPKGDEAPEYHHKPDDLLCALRLIRERQEQTRPIQVEKFQELLRSKPVSVEKKAKQLMALLIESGSMYFTDVVSMAKSRSEIVAMFLAVLELLGDQRIHLAADTDELRLGAQPVELEKEGGEEDGSDLHGKRKHRRR